MSIKISLSLERVDLLDGLPLEVVLLELGVAARHVLHVVPLVQRFNTFRFVFLTSVVRLSDSSFEHPKRPSDWSF